MNYSFNAHWQHFYGLHNRKRLKWIKQKLSCKSCSNTFTVRAQLKCSEAVLHLPTQTQVTQMQYFLPSVAPEVPAALVPADSVIMRSNAVGRRASLMSDTQANDTRRKQVLCPNVYPQSRDYCRQTALVYSCLKIHAETIMVYIHACETEKHTVLHMWCLDSRAFK